MLNAQIRRTARIVKMVFLLLPLAACVDYDRAIKVSDVRKEEVVTVKSNQSSGHVYGINIRGTGNIDGEASISLILNGEPYKTEILKGEVSFEWDGDWYSDTAEIVYKPKLINSGELVIEYNFFILK